jgi:hypothetical protein
VSAELTLKPCPFCGVVPVIERCDDTMDSLYGPRKWWGIKCRSTLNRGGTCAVEIQPQASVEAAVARWNMRAPAAPWHDETLAPSEPGWFVVRRADGTLCPRAFANGAWWIPLKDGWLSGLPKGFSWFGPFAPVEWDTPQVDAP